MANVDLGTLTVKLAADVAEIKKGMADAQKEVKSTADIMKAEFAKAGGYIGSVGERIGNVGKNLRKVLGDEAPAILQKFGADVQHAMGMSDAQVKGLGQSMEALEGGFKLAGLAVSAITPTVAAVAGAVAGVVLAVESLRDGFTNGFGAAHAVVAALMAPLVMMSLPILAGVGAVRLFKMVWAEVGDNVKAVWETIKTFGSNVASSIAGTFDGVVRAVGAAVAAVIEDVASALKWIEDNDPTGLAAAAGGSGAARGAAKGIRDASQNFDSGALLSAAGGAASQAWTDAKAKVGEAADSVATGFASIVQTAKDDIKALTDGLASVLSPGSKKGGKGKPGKPENITGILDAQANEWEAQNKKATEHYAAIGIASDAANDEILKSIEENSAAQLAQEEEIARLKEANFDTAMENIKASQEQAERERDALAAKWQALGSGSFGTAAGVTGLGGAVLNQVGQAAVGQSQYLGGALQGAAAGGEAAGPWGAVIGALVGLASQSNEFKAIMKEIDQVLEAVINALGKVIGVFQDLFDGLSELGGMFDMIGSLLGVLAQLDLGMQALTLIFKELAKIDFSGATTFFDDVGKQWEALFDEGLGPAISESGTWGSSTQAEWDAYNAKKERERKEKEEKDFGLDTAKEKVKGISEFDDAIRQARISTVLLGDAEYQAKAKAEYFATTLVSMAQAGIDYRNQLELLKTAQGGDQYIQNAIDAAKLEEQKAKLDEIVADRLEALGLGAEKAIDALAKFSDSLINEATGYRLGATRYGSTSEGGPGGAGEAQIDTHMGGGLGIGSAPGTTIVVTLDGAEIAHKIERRRERAQMAGVSSFARAPMLVGG